MSEAEKRQLLIASFQGPDALLAAVRAARERGFAVADVYTPFAVHGMDEALGLRRSRLGIVTMLGGLAGMIGAIALQVGTAVIDWPLDVGGKPANSALAFLPVTFELTILFGGLATAAAFLFQSRLVPKLRPARLASPPGVTDDDFVLVLAAPSDGPSATAARELLSTSGARDVRLEAAR